MLPAALSAAVAEWPVLQRLRPHGGAPSGAILERVEALCDAVFHPTGHNIDRAGLSLFKGGLWYALDALDAAHSIFQDDPSPEGSYWHGMLHRREGDFPNAKYWLQRAGRIPALMEIPDFDPVRFVSLCQRADRDPLAEDPAELLAMQRLEWEHLLAAAYKKARRP